MLGKSLRFYLSTTALSEDGSGLAWDFGPCEEIKCVRVPHLTHRLSASDVTSVWQAMCLSIDGGETRVR